MNVKLKLASMPCNYIGTDCGSEMNVRFGRDDESTNKYAQ
jgi:hypothetical protein